MENNLQPETLSYQQLLQLIQQNDRILAELPIELSKQVQSYSDALKDDELEKGSHQFQRFYQNKSDFKKASDAFVSKLQRVRENMKLVIRDLPPVLPEGKLNKNHNFTNFVCESLDQTILMKSKQLKRNLPSTIIPQ